MHTQACRCRRAPGWESKVASGIFSPVACSAVLTDVGTATMPVNSPLARRSPIRSTANHHKNTIVHLFTSRPSQQFHRATQPEQRIT
jgi:hypothetical protein